MTPQEVIADKGWDTDCTRCQGLGCGACSAATWPDAGSIDCRDYTDLECYVAGALSTMAPFDTEFSPRTLPFARRALEAVSEWEPTDG